MNRCDYCLYNNVWDCSHGWDRLDNNKMCKDYNKMCKYFILDILDYSSFYITVLKYLPFIIFILHYCNFSNFFYLLS